jgi:hypothetical protein
MSLAGSAIAGGPSAAAVDDALLVARASCVVLGMPACALVGAPGR